MDSSQFHRLIANFTTLNDNELSDVRNLCSKHPYSQILHAIQARAAHDLNQKDESNLLHQSAVYATDRSVLKKVMTVAKSPRLEPAPVAEMPRVAVSPEKIKTETTKESAPKKIDEVAPKVVAPVVKPEPKPALTSVAPELSGDALRADLLAELNKLQSLKHKFEDSVEAFERQTHHQEELNHPEEPNQTEEPKRKRGRPKSAATDTLLEEIQTTKKELPIESPRQKEQNEIIDQFIKEKPIILKPKPGEPAKDLSEDSGAFSDNIISETLVGILLKQGKKDKAIEVLRKLIWKFPQKKAYFAAQIDSLKN